MHTKTAARRVSGGSSRLSETDRPVGEIRKRACAGGRHDRTPSARRLVGRPAALGRRAIRRSLIAFGVAVGCLVLPQSGWAASTVLTFEGLLNGEQVLQFYNGGAGSLGSVGPDYDIEFGSAALANRDADAGGSGNFANEPSPDTIVFFIGGTGVVMNVPTGMQDGFSFFYSSVASASVTVYDGLDATGTVLATLPLSRNAQAGGCTGDPTGQFCHWDPVGVTFSGTARSVSFGGAANRVGFDDITLGSATPGEPTNSPPVADAGGPYVGEEGSPIALDGSATADADGDALTYAWSVTSDASNDAGGACTVADATAAETSIACNDDGTYTATLEVSDGTATDSASATVTVANVAPQIGALAVSGATGTACASNTVSLSFSVTDASALDEADLDGTVDWGDGTTTSYSGASFSGSHAYGPGTYTIAVTADDQDGGTDTASTTVARVYMTSGFLPPIDNDGSSVFKLGSTIPVKLAVVDCSGAAVGTLTPDVDLTRIAPSPVRAVGDVASSSAADTTDDMRVTGGRFMYNLSTKRSRFCQTGAPLCGNPDLTPGTYELRVTDEAANDAFAPVVVRITLR